jgi:2-polyprenyl-6-methoxyphenol hydroxylase-like FAD-dependent oxidoreductase
MNFVFGGNGFFGYFFSQSAESAPHRDSPYYVTDPGESLAWWSTYTVDECPTPATLDKEVVTQQLQKRHSTWSDPVIQNILKSLKVENMYPTWTVPPLPTWERDGVVLVGDAAHALPPTSGQGSSQALEDVEAFSLFLSHYLRKSYERQDVESVDHKEIIKMAAKKYMDLRLPRVTKILHAAQSSQDSKRDKGVIQEYIMYAFLWILGENPYALLPLTELGKANK